MIFPCSSSSPSEAAPSPSIPDCLWLEIFHHLDHGSLCLGARLVCRRWRDITHDGELWRQVTIPTHYTDRRTLLLLSAVHAEVEELDFSTCENITAEGFGKIAELDFPRLHHLEMPIVNTLPDAVYDKFAKVCPELEEIENITANFDDTCSPLKCQALFPKLKVLYDKPIATYGRVRKAMPTASLLKLERWLKELEHVSKACPDIETYRCRRGQEYMTDSHAERVSRLFPNLTGLDLYYCSLSDAGMNTFLLQQGGRLKTVSIDHPGALTDQGIGLLAMHCPNLRSFKISRCSGITNETLRQLSLLSQKLQELHVHNMQITSMTETSRREQFNDTGLANISIGCPQLNNLRVFYTEDVTAEGLTCLHAGCPWLQAFMLYECHSIDDRGLMILQKFRWLKALVLVDCDGITPDGIIDLVLNSACLSRLTLFCNGDRFSGDMEDLSIATYSKLEAMTHLRPNVLQKITLKGVNGGFVQLLTVLCPRLHSLDLREKNLIGPLSLASVLRNCEELRVLDVQSLYALNDEFLHGVADFGHNLRKLGLGNTVRQMSTRALINVIAHCRSLTEISMDTKDTDIKEQLLVAAAKIHHGNQSFLHVDPDCRQEDRKEGRRRFISLHFTPSKYLGSVPTVKVKQRCSIAAINVPDVPEVAVPDIPEDAVPRDAVPDT